MRRATQALIVVAVGFTASEAPMCQLVNRGTLSLAGSVAGSVAEMPRAVAVSLGGTGEAYHAVF